MRFYNPYGQLTISIRLITHYAYTIVIESFVKQNSLHSSIPIIPNNAGRRSIKKIHTARNVCNTQALRRKIKYMLLNSTRGSQLTIFHRPNYPHTRARAYVRVLDTRNVITRQTETPPPLPSRHATERTS